MSPTQLFVRYIEDVHQFHSLRDYAVSLKGKPDGAYPLVRLPAQMRAAVRQEMKGQAQDAIHHAADRGERDVIFLFHLFINANGNVLLERRANWLQALLLSQTLHATAEGEAPRFGRQPWEEVGADFLLQVYAEAGAVKYLANRYFGGRSPLFSQVAEDLQELVRLTEQVVEMYTTRCSRWTKPQASAQTGRWEADRPRGREEALSGAGGRGGRAHVAVVAGRDAAR